MFSILHGGYVRASAIAATADTTAWTSGRLLALNSSAHLIVHTGIKGDYPGVGVAGENRILSTSTGPTTTVTKVGAPSGATSSYILDESVIQMDQNLESGVTFTPGAVLYASTNGKVTTSGNGTGSDSPHIGLALSEAFASDPGRPLTWLFSVTY